MQMYCHLSTWNCALKRLVCHLEVICSVSFLLGFPATVTNSISTLPFLAAFIRAMGSPLNCVGSKPAPGGGGLRGSKSSYRSSSSTSSSLSWRIKVSSELNHVATIPTDNFSTLALQHLVHYRQGRTWEVILSSSYRPRASANVLIK